MKNYRIAALPADGIGSEVIDAGLRVLAALAPATLARDLNCTSDCRCAPGFR